MKPWFFIALCFVFSLRSFANEPNGPTILLYDAEKKDGVPFKGPLLPHRIYIQYQSDLKSWQLVETDGEASLGDHPSILLPGTVVPGFYFGYSSSSKRYKLGRNGIWAVTTDTEKHLVLELGPNPMLRSLTYHPQSTTKVRVASGNR